MYGCALTWNFSSSDQLDSSRVELEKRIPYLQLTVYYFGKDINIIALYLQEKSALLTN